MRAATGPGRAHFIRGFKRTQTMHSDDKLKLDDLRVFNFDGYEREDIHVCVRALESLIESFVERLSQIFMRRVFHVRTIC